MNSLQKHYWTVVREDLCLKSRNFSPYNLPALKKVELETSFTENEAFLFLELLGLSKPCLIQNIENQKGQIVGCRLTLRKKAIYRFLQTWIIEFISFSKDFGVWKNQSLEIIVQDPFISQEIRRFYLLFEKLSILKIKLFFDNGSEDFCQSFRIPRDK
jgi:hypothetical protein